MAALDSKNFCLILLCCIPLAAASKPNLNNQVDNDFTVAVLQEAGDEVSGMPHVAFAGDVRSTFGECPNQAGSIARKLRAVRKMC